MQAPPLHFPCSFASRRAAGCFAASGGTGAVAASTARMVVVMDSSGGVHGVSPGSGREYNRPLHGGDIVSQAPNHRRYSAILIAAQVADLDPIVSRSLDAEPLP